MPKSVFHCSLCIQSVFVFFISFFNSHSHTARCQYMYYTACSVGFVEASATPLWLHSSIANQVGLTWLGGW